MPRATLKRKRAFEGVDYPRRPRLTKSIDEIIDASIRADEDLFAGKLSMVRRAPREQADTGQFLDPSRSRRIFDKDALREQMLKNKNKRIATTTASPTSVASVPVGQGRFKMQSDFKGFIIEMATAIEAFVRNERPVDTRANLNFNNFPPYVREVFLQKHPWREQILEFLRWFFTSSAPGETQQDYEKNFEKLATELIIMSDFNKEYMGLSQNFAVMIATLLEDYLRTRNQEDDPRPPADDDDEFKDENDPQAPSVLQVDNSWDDMVPIPFGEEKTDDTDEEDAPSYWAKQETKMKEDEEDISDLIDSGGEEEEDDSGRFKMQPDSKEFITEMREAGLVWLRYVRRMREGDMSLDSLRDNLFVDSPNFPEIVKIVYLQKHPWKDLLLEFLDDFRKATAPGIAYNNILWQDVFSRFVVKLIQMSDFTEEYSEDSHTFLTGIEDLLYEYDEAVQRLSKYGDDDDVRLDPSQGGRRGKKEQKEDKKVLPDVVEGEDESDMDPMDRDDLSDLVLGQNLSAIVSFFYRNNLTMDKDTERKLLARKEPFTSEEVKDAAEVITILLNLTAMDEDYISQTQEDSLQSLVRVVNNLQNHTAYDPVIAVQTREAVQEMLAAFDKWREMHKILPKRDEEEEEEEAVVFPQSVREASMKCQ